MLSKVDALVPITKIDEHEFKLLGCTKPLFTCITGVDVLLYQKKIENMTLSKKSGVIMLRSQ